MTDTNHDPWRPLCNAETTRQELDRVIEDEVQLQLADLRAQIARMDLDERDMPTALLQLEAVIRERVTSAVVAGWESLQLDVSASRALH